MWIDDDIIGRCHEPIALAVWVPNRTVVVLGSSNDPEVECRQDLCKADGISILKRYGGGGTVVLHPGCVIISCGTWVQQPYANDVYFKKINQALIDSLASSWPALKALTQAGISDVVFDKRKIAGTSLFRSRQYLLYQASILADPRPELMARYLAHPSKEPDYRQGRDHGSFVTGIEHLVSEANTKEIESILKQSFQKHLRLVLGDDLIAPQAEQFEHLRKRAGLMP